jgi:hypothetical protein
LPGSAPQNGQRTDSGLTGSISGISGSSFDIAPKLRFGTQGYFSGQ